MASSNENVFAADSNVQWEMKRKSSFTKLAFGQPRGMPGMYKTRDEPFCDEKNEKLWKLMDSYLPTDMRAIQRHIVNHVEYTLAKTPFNLDGESCYRATAISVRDRLIKSYNDTSAFFVEEDAKRVYYLSLEFLMGRALQNSLVNMDVEDTYRAALTDLGYDLETLYTYEHDPALGNGGLGRLAACFLDSMATLNLPCWGYGIRYSYGIFEQKIVNGWQIEYPDYWLVTGNPWEIARLDVTYAVRFYGYIKEYKDKNGAFCKRWCGGDVIQAVAHNNPIPGFDTYNTLNLRLWRACPGKEFDFQLFNIGQYLESVHERQKAESITAVLYPNDNTAEGKELRLKQQYFFVCATIQDVLRRFKKRERHNWADLPQKLQIQLNDTHPTIAIPELLRILMDIEQLEWRVAWPLVKQCFNYTNHTVLPEALEKWPVTLLHRLLPRHLLIINDINFDFLNEVRGVMGNDGNIISRMSIFEEGDEKRVRMANLAVIGSKKVNGVAEIHSDLVKSNLFPDFVEFFSRKNNPDKFCNVTNGVTPRRWIHCSNPALSKLLSSWLGSDEWLKELDLLKHLLPKASSTELQNEWARVKMENKRRLAEWVYNNCDVKLDHETMLFDVQVKRIHEYKRQLLNCLYMVHRYLNIKRMSPSERANVVPRACLIGGKAAPGYHTAKVIIKLTNSIADLVNNDTDIGNLLKVVFLPNYNVSNAQIIVPASDISQHISTAGTEASGTSNMKFVMNGGLIIGTLDGANIEIRQECGDDTMFIFGLKENQVSGIANAARHGNYPIDGRLNEVFDYIRSGALSQNNHDTHVAFTTLVNSLTNNGYGHLGDRYLLCHDFPDYCRAQKLVDDTYTKPEIWWKLSIKAALSMGKFSTDRCMADYAAQIWDVEPHERPPPEIERTRSFVNDPREPIPETSDMGRGKASQKSTPDQKKSQPSESSGKGSASQAAKAGQNSWDRKVVY